MGPQLLVSLWHIATAPNQHSTNRPLPTSIPRRWHSDATRSGGVTMRGGAASGVAPRYESRHAETDTDRSDAVNLATSLWLDEITRPAPDLPPFSWMIETSVGKVQAGYFLEEPTADLDRVEHLNQRLGVVVGGDNVWNRGRILRLPGFINLNHPGGQRARLVEFHPDLAME